jgi:diguanylate cyclase (GGDEF)-like protein/PAS domain S-box-containing protein
MMASEAVRAAPAANATKLHAIVANAPLALFALDRDGVFTFSDGQGLAVLGQGPGQMVGASVFQVWSEVPALVAQARRALAGHPVKQAVEVRSRWLETTWSPILERDGRVGAVVRVATDVTDHLRAQQRLRAALEREQALTETAADVIVLADRQGRILYANPSVERMFGYRQATVVGQPLTLLVPDRRNPAHAGGRAGVVPGDLGRLVGQTVGLTGRHRDGAELPVELSLASWTVGGQRVLVGRLRDITDRRALEDQLLHQALHDALTGLPNRALFGDRLEQALAHRPGPSQQAALLLVDLDDFTAVNDRYGHAIGDRLLAAAAARLGGCLRDGDMMARVGGDQFAVLLEGVGEPEAHAMARALAAAFEGPIRLDDREVPAQVSIGVAVTAASTTDPQDPDGLLRQAEVALAAAKEAGKGRIELFTPGRHRGAWDDLALRADLEHAVADEQFELLYQPIVALATGQAAGVEALVRWQHPSRGLLGPGEFIPLAERTGLIVPLGRLVLAEACRQVRRWRDRHPDRPLRLGVNLSARQLDHGQLVAEVAQALEDAQLDPATVTLELTETVLVRDADLAVTRLRELKGLGVRLAVDDFGTGYSSLGYLDRLPVDVLKIDKTFIDRLTGTGREGTALIAAILRIAQTLGLETVAEGVERPEQASQLRALGCHYAQGYLYAKPLQMDEVDSFLTQQAPTPATGAHVTR